MMHSLPSSGTQAEHDARHPGLICQNCPITIERSVRGYEFASWLRLPWYKRLFRNPPT